MMKAPFIHGITNIYFDRWSRLANRFWQPYSRLLFVADAGFWSVAWDMQEVKDISLELGIKSSVGTYGRHAHSQSVFFGSHFELLFTPAYFRSANRLATAYFHGMPGTGVPEFDDCYNKLKENHERISRIQVTHKEIHDLVLSSGISPDKIFVIPIGINTDFFSMRTADSQKMAREKLGISQSAIVIGSFQKDGVGWGDGYEPKLIKGPDVLIGALIELKTRIPELFVLLSGPARGYVKRELTRLNIPFTHRYIENYPDIDEFYQAIDLYIVASRQEGGPKSILESMATGVPIVSTRVGQATHLIRHGENGWLTDVGDSEALAYFALRAINDTDMTRNVQMEARKTAEQNSYNSQLPLWREFMRGFVGFED